MEDVTATLRSESGVVVDAFREMRGKLYMGQVRPSSAFSYL